MKNESKPGNPLQSVPDPEFPTFHLGLVLAGAVSAGAYSAGVMDYLLWTLEEWEIRKEANRKILRSVNWDWTKAKHTEGFDETVPMHNIQIDVLAGASAGGMTAAIAFSKLLDPVNDNYYARCQSEAEINKLKLFDPWVNLYEQEDNRKTLSQLLDPSDLKYMTVSQNPETKQYEIKGGLRSLLNSNFIHNIAYKKIHLSDHFKEQEKISEKEKQNWKNYISKDLRILLTVCSLRGVPVGIPFKTKWKKEKERDEVEIAHKIFFHKGHAHFKYMPIDETNGIYGSPSIKKNLPKGQEYIPLNHFENESDQPRTIDTRSFLDAAIATGSFPLAFEPKTLWVTNSYIENQVMDRLRIPEKLRVSSLHGGANDWFQLTAVDGGTVNNEPIEEVEALLQRCIEKSNEEEGRALNHPKEQEKEPQSYEKDQVQNYGMIMIDPFPNFQDEKAPLESSYLPTVPTLANRLIGALRHQAMVKEKDVMQSFSGENDMRIPRIRGLIFPNNDHDKESPLACGALDGFSGFFSREFRVHDFELGRKNCHGFLAKHFKVPTERIGQYGLNFDDYTGHRVDPNDAPMNYITSGIDDQHPMLTSDGFFNLIPIAKTWNGDSWETVKKPVPQKIKVADKSDSNVPMNRRIKKLSKSELNINYQKDMITRFRQLLKVGIHSLGVSVPKLQYPDQENPWEMTEPGFLSKSIAYLARYSGVSIAITAALLILGIFLVSYKTFIFGANPSFFWQGIHAFGVVACISTGILLALFNWLILLKLPKIIAKGLIDAIAKDLIAENLMEKKRNKSKL